MKSRFLAAFLAATAMAFTATPALADRGDPAPRVWMNGASRADIVAAFLAGRNPCYGSNLMHTCYAYSPVTEELLVQQVSRPRGLSKNLVVNTVMQLTADGVVMRTESGVVLARYQAGSEQQNAASIWNTALSNMLPAAAQGLGSTALCTIAGCNNGSGGGGATAISISDAAAQTLFEGVFSGGGNCTTGSCAYQPKP